MNTFKDHHHLICRHLLDGTILSANATAATSLGVTPAALVGRKVQDFLSDEGRASFGSYIDRITAQIRSRRLLMVEDEPAIIEGLVELLRDAHLEVSTVMSGEEAVAAVDSFEPDVVLLDFGLPGIDGLETCRRIRARRPGMRVIFSSGHGTQTQLGISGDESHTQYLQKPFEIAALLEAIAAVEAAP